MDDECCKQWLKVCQAEIPVGRNTKFGRDELAHYYYAQTMFNLGDDNWSGYLTAMADHLRSSQNNDGSWPSGDGLSVGPTYSTAVWCIVLQVDKENHPSRTCDLILRTTMHRFEPALPKRVLRPVANSDTVHGFCLFHM
jgi:hypothetical protein